MNPIQEDVRVLVGEEHVDTEEDPGSPALMVRYLSMNYQKLVKQLRSHPEGRVHVPGGTSLEEEEVWLLS